MEKYREPVAFKSWEDTKKYVLGEFEKLLETPKITSIQFSFEASLDMTPEISYKVTRWSE